MYSSKPTAATCPDCSSPSRSPAPRMSRSRIAILKPEPSSVWSARVESRAAASSLKASAEDLVRLGQAELVGALDDQRVGAGDVQPGLDDRRRHQAVGVAAQEAEHRLLELLFVHLAVRFDEARLGHEAAQALDCLGQRVDPVVQEEGLAAALELTIDRLGDEVLVVGP